MIFQPSDIISTYSRKQAIKDGFQVCISDLFPNDTRMYKYPVYFTNTVWELCQEKGVVIWDICYMAALASKVNRSDSSTIPFSVIVQGAEKKPDFFEDELPCYRLLAQCSPLDFDNPKPAITIMFPDEQ